MKISRSRATYDRTNANANATEGNVKISAQEIGRIPKLIFRIGISLEDEI